MVLNKGGYVMINKAQDNVYELATSALTSGKPILWYESNTECYFIDTITLSGTDIILTKGGKTITIESDGDITESGEVGNPTLENIKDLDGNLRFIEGDISTNAIDGVTYTFNKWSLSGSHLMFVVAGTVTENTVLSYGTNSLIKCNAQIPQWIKDKIYSMISNKVDVKSFTLLESGTTTQSFTFTLYKESNNILLQQSSDLTLDKNRGFRVQFDLLID